MARSVRGAFVALVALAVLAGCTASPVGPSSPATSSPTKPATSLPARSALPTPSITAPTASPSTAAETRYVTTVQQLSSTLSAVDPAILLALGHDVCRSLAAGRSVQQVAESFGDLGETAEFSGSEAAVIIGAAVPTLCPQYRAKLND